MSSVFSSYPDRKRVNRRHRSERAAAATELRPSGLRTWIRLQSVNVARHAMALRPFHRSEFGQNAPAPTDSHIGAANRLIASLRRRLTRRTQRVAQAVESAKQEPTTRLLQSVVNNKHRAHNVVQMVERVWDFYFELFGQRQSQFGNWLLSCDRIALDCYQVAFLGIGQAKSIPAPAPFCYMRTGFSPATFRRGIRLRKLGANLNPFPLIQLPYHRLVNPWTLGAILHEVSHNLQNELGLARVIPQAIGQRLREAGLGNFVASVWQRWNRESFADLSGLLLGGPAVVGSLMDVIGRTPAVTLGYSSRGPHPTPYLRTLLSIELLRHMGFDDEAESYLRSWTRLYPDPRSGSIPPKLLSTFDQAKVLVVDTMCYQPYEALGNKSLSQVIRFARKEQLIVDEAAMRLAAGNDPGVVPERFLIGATRVAIERQLAKPSTIVENFYKELARR